MTAVAASSRDLVGYGRNRPKHRWPNGARVAVSLVVNFEEGAELSIEEGDPVSEHIGEIASVVKPGGVDRGIEQTFTYGMRAGFWRFLDALEKHRKPATFYLCGRAVERASELARLAIEAGHEPACHGWRWRPHADFESMEAEREALQRCIDVSLSATGDRPLGFFCRGSESRWTRSLLRQMGFLYTSNGFDDDLPYWDRDPAAEPLLVVPFALDSNDVKFFHPNGFADPFEFVRYVQSALQVLLGEAAEGKSSVLNIGLHLRICGRPARFLAVQEILKHLDSLGDSVWVARRIDIARDWIGAFPKG